METSTLDMNVYLRLWLTSSVQGLPRVTQPHLSCCSTYLKRLRWQHRMRGHRLTRMHFWASCRPWQASQKNLSCASSVSFALHVPQRHQAPPHPAGQHAEAAHCLPGMAAASCKGIPCTARPCTARQQHQQQLGN